MGDLIERSVRALAAYRDEFKASEDELSLPVALQLVELVNVFAEVVTELKRLQLSDWVARGERDSMRRRLTLLTADESWWVGGVWGEYGEVVVPVRAVHMVLGELVVGQEAVGEPELRPGLAATYRDLRATVENLSGTAEKLQAAVDLHEATLTEMPDGSDRWLCCRECGQDWPCATATAAGVES